MLLAVVSWFLYRTHAGLVLRAVGDSHDAAHAIGYPVIAIRFAAVAVRRRDGGLAGGYMSLSYSPIWAENMTAGRGWIALALVVFATWRPARLLRRRLSLRRHHVSLQLYVQGTRRAHPVAVPLHAALSRHRRRAGDDLARPTPDPPQRAGLPRQVVPRGGRLRQIATLPRSRPDWTVITVARFGKASTMGGTLA